MFGMIEVLCQPWEKYDFTFGQGASGYSIHKNAAAHAAYVAERQAKIAHVCGNERPYRRPYWIRIDQNKYPLSASDLSRFVLVSSYGDIPPNTSASAAA